MTIAEIVGIYAAIIATILALKEIHLMISNKPKLLINSVHPAYQWFFILPSGKHQKNITRKYGFLAYISLKNRGKRAVSLESWLLYLKTTGAQWVELPPISIPEPRIKLGKSGHLKICPVLGQKGPYSQGNVTLKPGNIISGFVYYVAGFYGDRIWNPLIKDGKAHGKIIVQDVFGNKSDVKILFTKISLEKARGIVDNIDKIDL